MSRAGTFGVPYVGNDFSFQRIVKIKPQTPQKTENEIKDEEIIFERLVLDKPITQSEVDALEKIKAQSHHSFIKKTAVFLAIFVVLSSASWLAIANLSTIRSIANLYFKQKVATTAIAAASPTISPAFANKLNSIETQTITFTAGGSTITTSSDDISSWLNINAAKSTVSINTAAVSSYLAKIDSEFTVNPVNRIVTTSSTGVSTIAVKGANGASVVSSQAALSQISNSLLSGSGMSIALPMVSTPFTTLTNPA